MKRSWPDDELPDESMRDVVRGVGLDEVRGSLAGWVLLIMMIAGAPVESMLVVTALMLAWYLRDGWMRRA